MFANFALLRRVENRNVVPSHSYQTTVSCGDFPRRFRPTTA